MTVVGATPAAAVAVVDDVEAVAGAAVVEGPSPASCMSNCGGGTANLGTAGRMMLVLGLGADVITGDEIDGAGTVRRAVGARSFGDTRTSDVDDLVASAGGRLNSGSLFGRCIQSLDCDGAGHNDRFQIDLPLTHMSQDASSTSSSDSSLLGS